MPTFAEIVLGAHCVVCVPPACGMGVGELLEAKQGIEDRREVLRENGIWGHFEGRDEEGWLIVRVEDGTKCTFSPAEIALIIR